ncbi:MAG TPA: class I SAM-dependent methyltransferase [Acidimicrobiia bacterium]|nr:class I SAM-dependent methyltransferase [Acidimicrobiia bacterium]
MSRDDVTGREREFHDHLHTAGGRERTTRFYSVTDVSRAYYTGLVLDGADGLSVLEYGCGSGSQAFDLARRGASVDAIDISEAAITRARETARAGSVKGVSFHVMDAQDLDFRDSSFDRVCGSGILHHLDLEAALTEVARVLRPQGTAVFFEPMGHNPLINLYRRGTPDLRSVDEHPLRMADLRLAEGYFEEVRPRFFHLSTLAAVPLHRFPGQARLAAMFDGVDRFMFRIVPWLRRLAWIVVIELGSPRKQ